jgi:hypothetical protein
MVVSSMAKINNLNLGVGEELGGYNFKQGE